MVDLKGLTIDLRANEPGNSAAFADLFYQRLRKSLNSGQPLGLDLSYALIQGDLDFSRLSLRVPAYGGLSLPALDAFNREFQPLLSKDVLSDARPDAWLCGWRSYELSSRRTGPIAAHSGSACSA
ncbi:MAG: hypothetical protein ACR2FS_21165 [Phormidesmis sp.]